MKKIIGILISIFSLTALAETEYCSDGVNKVSRSSSEFIILKDKGLVIDKRTQLMWKLCAEGFIGEQCLYPESPASGYELAKFDSLAAMKAAEASTFSGYNDWVLPNIKQLRSITELSCHFNFIHGNILFKNSKVFPNDTKYVDYINSDGTHISWSSTPSSSSPSYMLISSVTNSANGDKSHSFYNVQLVREPSRQELLELLNDKKG